MTALMHFPGIEEMTLGIAGSTRAETNLLGWHALLTELTEERHPYVDEGGFRLPTKAQVVTARRTPG